MNLDFWLTFVLLMLTVMLLLTPLLQHASFLSGAVVGGYAAVVPFDHYLGGNLKYIVINTLRRASVPGFSLAILDPPFQATGKQEQEEGGIQYRSLTLSRGSKAKSSLIQRVLKPTTAVS